LTNGSHVCGGVGRRLGIQDLVHRTETGSHLEALAAWGVWGKAEEDRKRMHRRKGKCVNPVTRSEKGTYT